MSEITGKQKRFLRGLGQQLSPAAVIGRAGLSDESSRNVARLLADHELIKVRLPEGPQRKTVAADLAETVGATCICLVGRTAVLYRPNDKLDSTKRIRLP